MATFRFPLEGVLRHRKLIEEQKQREMASLQQEMRLAQDALRELNESAQQTIGDLRQNHLVGRLDLAFLAAHRRYMLAVHRRGTNMAQKMALLQRQIDDARGALLTASVQRKVIEKLRDNQKERWAAEIARKEFVELDEISQRMAASRAMTSLDD